MVTINRQHRDGEPTWDIARLFPAQGFWSEEEYLTLPGNHLVEFSQGRIEVLPMPTYSHQLLVAFLYQCLLGYLAGHPVARVIFAPLRVRLWEGKFREPDIVLMCNENSHRIYDRYWVGADLVMEVISPDDPLRDTRLKRREYAQAGIPEYWIIDPTAASVTVLALDKGESVYRVHEHCTGHGKATSILLADFAIDTQSLFAELQRQAGG